MSLVVPSLRGIVASAPWAKNELWRKALAAPTLDLRFADSKSLTDAVSGQNLITFTRASSGTYVGSDGLIKTALADAPRFDHNPVTGESLGLLIEEQRTNLLLQSEDLTNVAWSSSNLVNSADAATAPNGTVTADELIENTATNIRSKSQSITSIASTNYALSIYAKQGAGDQRWLRLSLNKTGDTSLWAAASYDLIDGMVDSSNANGGGVVASTSIIALGNGWYRCVLVGNIGANTDLNAIVAPTIAPFTYTPNGRGRTSYEGDGVSSLYYWGAQLEANAPFPTSYIPTTSAQVTRNADVASITGDNFSSWYRQDEGTVFADAINSALSTAIFAVSDGSTGNRIQADAGTDSRVARVVTGGVTQASNSVSYAYGAQQSFAVSYLLNSINFANAGTLGTEDTSATIPTVNQLRIGANPTGASALNSTISRLAFFSSRLPDATLQAITSP